jgi:putative DNA primase/helicase
LSAATIARRLGGYRSGHNWRCACPLGCGYTLALRDGDDEKLLAHCFGGCEFDDILIALVEYGLLDDIDSSGRIDIVNGSAIRRHDDDAERIVRARQIYGWSATDKRVSAYLHSRGIILTSPVLRFSEQAPHRLGIHLPAMIAPVVNINGEQTGTHMTFLRADYSGKADIGKDFQRECRGLVRGGAIRLTPHDPNRELLIGEGIESTLSAMQLFGLPGWSAINAGGLKTIELPPAVRRVVIAADNDASGTGWRNALAAYERWTAESRSVRIKSPPIVGDDFNDTLIRRQG